VKSYRDAGVDIGKGDRFVDFIKGIRSPAVDPSIGGFSAAIDGSGRLVARGPRRDTATLRAAVHPDGRWSPWLTAGTLPAGLTLAVVVMLGLERLVGSRLAPPGVSGRQ